MQNTERQRLIRERNPGYYARQHRRRRAREKAGLQQHLLAEQAEAAAARAAVESPKIQLLLPAPMPVFDLAFWTQQAEARELECCPSAPVTFDVLSRLVLPGVTSPGSGCTAGTKATP